MRNLIEIITERLLIVPCSLEIAKSLVFQRAELEQKSPILFPVDWPSTAVTNLLPLYIEKLEKDKSEYGWGIWIVIDYTEKQIIGDVIFHGKPDKKGTIQVTYNMISDVKDDGLSYEACDALIEWRMTTHSKVKKIITECSENDHKSIKLFEKLGMRCTKKDRGFLTWEVWNAV